MTASGVSLAKTKLNATPLSLYRCLDILRLRASDTFITEVLINTWSWKFPKHTCKISLFKSFGSRKELVTVDVKFIMSTFDSRPTFTLLLHSRSLRKLSWTFNYFVVSVQYTHTCALMCVCTVDCTSSDLRYIGVRSKSGKATEGGKEESWTGGTDS